MRPEEPIECSASSGQQEVAFSLLTWNVDGLDENNIPERARSVCSFIYESQPDIVLLQEVVAENIQIFKRCPGYVLNAPRADKFPYFCALLIRQASFKCLSVDTVDFPSTTMGRHVTRAALQLRANQADVVVFTSHLESTARFAAERKSQLQFVFSQIQRTASSAHVIFGGDLNVRDQEVAAVGVPDCFQDAWEVAGRPHDCRYTWDRSKNDNIEGQFQPRVKYRFDRVYFSNKLNLESFGFVGQERLLSCGRFPSDHFGVTCRVMTTAQPTLQRKSSALLPEKLQSSPCV